MSYISFQISCNESKLSQTYVLYQFQATSWKLAALLIATWASAKSLSIVQQQRLREPFRISMVTIKYNHAEEIIQIVLMIATRKNRARKTDFFSVETAQFDIRCVITCLSSIEFPGHCCLYVGFFFFCFVFIRIEWVWNWILITNCGFLCEIWLKILRKCFVSKQMPLWENGNMMLF